MTSSKLTLAQHSHGHLYWEGGNYELNMSFESLRDKQWLHALQAIWNYPAMQGPFEARHVPGQAAPARISPQAPPPTATITQHGLFTVGEFVVGCDIQVTRSLFECISILIPVGMFNGVVGNESVRQHHPELEAVDQVFYEIALQVYDIAPFRIAAVGYERACQLPVELQSDSESRHNFLVAGNFLAQRDVLEMIEPDLTPYQEVRSDLYYLPPRQ